MKRVFSAHGKSLPLESLVVFTGNIDWFLFTLSPGTSSSAICARRAQWGGLCDGNHEHHRCHSQSHWKGRWWSGSELVTNRAHCAQVSHDWRVASSEGGVHGHGGKKPAAGKNTQIKRLKIFQPRMGRDEYTCCSCTHTDKNNCVSIYQSSE